MLDLRTLTLTALALSLANLSAVADSSRAAQTLVVPETIEVSLSELTSIEYEPGKELPKKIRELDGKEVVITGVMHADTGYDVTEFWLVTESCECATSPEPHHFVEVTLTSGTTSRKRGEMSFKGIFSVGEVLDENGFVESLYRLEGDFF